MRSDVLAGYGDAAGGDLTPASTDQKPSSTSPPGFTRSVARLLSVPLLLALLLAGFTAAVDPYWMFGTPSLPAVNESRPLYETNVVQAKPYQLLRLRPKSVALGSSRSEVGLSPDHPGWADSHAFNFAIPAANSYEVMLAFLHAQAVAAPLQQAVVGLDFLSFGIYRKVGPAFNDERFAWGDLKAFADFLEVTLAERRTHGPSVPGPSAPGSSAPAVQPTPADQPTRDEKLYLSLHPDVAAVVASGQFGAAYQHYRNYGDVPAAWDEALYLALYPEVARVVDSGQFGSGWEHYVKNGRAEGRVFASIPADWDEKLYRALYLDVAAAISNGAFLSGYVHYVQAGRAEGRLFARVPQDWNDKLYLALHPDVAAVVARGQFGSGYEHYLKNGQAEGRPFARVPSDWNEKFYLGLYPDADAAIASGQFGSGYEHYLKIGRVQGRQYGNVPSDWKENLYLTLYPDVAAAVAGGIFGSGYVHYLRNGRTEGRHYGGVPADWDEELYLALYRDVAAAISNGEFPSGYVHYIQAGRTERRLYARVPADWNEKLYVALYADVATTIARGQFVSGYEHYLKNGRAEGRLFARIPPDWDEATYLEANPAVAQALVDKNFISGYHHYLTVGRNEGRLGGFRPPDWNEAGYLAANPAARIAIARGQYRSGFLHYAAVGHADGRVGGLPSTTMLEWLKLQWPPLHSWLFKAKEFGELTFSFTALKDAIVTIIKQQSVPASFSDRGQRIWRGQDEVVLKMGGTGKIFRNWLSRSFPWGIFWFDPPEKMYCLSHPDTQMSGLDPFRFMVRRAYAEGTDLHLFVSPLHASIRRIIDAVGLDGRFEFWLRELARINEEEAARAGRAPFPLWDFSDTNSITAEPVPAAGDLKPMRWFWEVSHYRKNTGDLVLDRIFGIRDPSRPLPEDFGVRLTVASIDEHLDHSRTKRVRWAAANPDLTELIDNAARPPRQDRQREATCW